MGSEGRARRKALRAIAVRVRIIRAEVKRTERALDEIEAAVFDHVGPSGARVRPAS